MGLFNLFKKKVKEEVKEEAIKFEDLHNWVKETRPQNKEKEKKVFEETDKLILALIQELEEKIIALRKVDLKDNKKADERVKSIVMNSLLKYTDSLDVLIDNLKNIKKEGLENFIFEINNTFNYFEKESGKNFAKANYLVGKELNMTKESIAKFFKELNKILGENKEIISLLKASDSIEKSLGEFNENKKLRAELDKTIEKIKDELKESEEKKKLIETKIENIKKSEAYLEQERERAKANILEKNIDHEMLEVKNLIDFKSLIREFHSDSKKMNLIKGYQEDFKKIFRDSEILNFLDESKKQTIKDKIEKIGKKKKEISEVFSQENPLYSPKEELLRANSLIDSLNSELSRQEKRENKIYLDEIKDSIQKELSSLGIKLI